MPLFVGTHEPRLDEKGRIFLPARFRDGLAQGLVMTRGQEHCITVFPKEEFLRITEQMRTLPMSNRRSRDYVRVLLSGAHDDIPDRQGRVTIPTALRDYAGLSRDCTVIGAGPRVEIWDSATWARYLSETEQDFSDLSEEVLPGLI